MRPVLALSLFGMCILSSGCALIQDGWRNIALTVCKPIETHNELARNRRWAEAAWQKYGGMNTAPNQYMEDYAQGFKDGYAEFLYRGGNGEPPVMAPECYRKMKYQTPQGYVAVEQWFAGYRHGASVANETGARRWIIGPTGMLPEPPHADQPNVHYPPPQPEPTPLPMPNPLPKVSIEQKLPEGPAIEVTPPVEPLPEPTPPKARILGIGTPPAPVEESSSRPPTFSETTKATIKGIRVMTSEAPALPEPSAEPVRIRIRAVTPATEKKD